RSQTGFRCAGRQHVAGLVLAEEEAMRRQVGAEWWQRDLRPDAAGHRHFGERDEEAAVAQVMAGADAPRLDLCADEIAVAPLGFEIDRRRRALFALLDLPEIERGAEMALGVADQDDRLANRLEG